jgi:hypothetical protein
MAIVYFFLEVNFQTKSLSIPRGGVGRASFSVCCFVFLYFFYSGKPDIARPFLPVIRCPPAPHTHTATIDYHSTCRNFPDCPFSVVVRELPGALRPNRKRKKKLSGPFSLFVFFVCAFACDPRIFYSTDATVETGGERCERKRLCVFGNGLQKL